MADEEEGSGGGGTGGKREKKAGPAGMRVQAYGKDGPQRIRSWGKRFTPEAEAVFLGRMRVSCNVRYSADECGFSARALYQRRLRDPGFAERWRLARDDGFAHLESLLVEAAEATLSGCPRDPDSPIPPMTVSEAITLLKLHRGAVTGEGRRLGHGRSRPRSLEDMRESILRKLSAFERARRRGESGGGA
jgi:hypothetical protein